MERLAKLPVFFSLEGRRAVLAGGSAAAAWKAELLAAAGANVEVYAAEVGPEMEKLMMGGAAAGSIVLHSRAWSVDIFDCAAIALADAETECEAQAFYCAALAAGVPVNVIDKPDYCQFQFGSIVNRSPVIVSIATDGAAPILGQAIRRRIESVLPSSLAAWGQLARDIRERVSSLLRPGLQRRKFWEVFSEKAFGPPPDTDDRQDLDRLIEDLSNGRARAVGRVTIAGTGPGDPELITLKAVRALQSADLILYDNRVNPAVLELARREAVRLSVPWHDEVESNEGSRGGAGVEEDVHAKMITFVREGKHIVQLVGGVALSDEKVLARRERLLAEGINVSFIAGVAEAKNTA